MPELAEVRIMSDYINHHSKKRKFTKLYHVLKGNKLIICFLLVILFIGSYV